MRRKIFKKSISLILSVLFLLSMFPSNIVNAEEITEKIVKEIIVSRMPYKTAYAENSDTLDVTGGELEVLYEDSSTEKVSMTLDMITGFDNTVVGKQELTVTYLGCIAAFEVEVLEQTEADISEIEKYSEGTVLKTAEAQPKQSDFAGGNGTEASPYLISNYDQLNNMRNYLSAHFKLTKDIVIPEDNQSWTPIGTLSEPFTGTFDGAGHTITGLRINLQDSKDSYNYAGFFGYIDSGSVRNLGLVNADIYVYSSADKPKVYTGGIAGYVTKGNISGSYCTGNIQVSVKSPYGNSVYAGGITGYLEGDLLKCHNDAAVTVSSSSEKYGINYVNVYAGGNTGYINGNLTDCYNTGDIQGAAYSRYSSSIAYVGGISGNVSAVCEIQNCYNTGDIISQAESPIRESSLSDVYAFAGGITGRIDKNGSISGCSNEGLVSAEAKATATIGYAHAGGIAGTAYDNCIVSDCQNSGTIVSDVLSNISNTYGIDTMYAFSRSGGIVGYGENGCSFYSCRNTGELTSKVASVHSLGFAYTGGIVASVNSCTVEDCQNSGKITAVSQEQASDISMPTENYAYAGGIAGYISGKIANCNNSGDFDVISSSLDEDYAYIGGIAGYLDGTIQNCSNSGHASALSGDFGYAGGAAGDAHGLIANCSNSGSFEIHSYDRAYAGGIAGRIENNSTENNSIENCYNTGKISATSQTTSNMPCVSYAGGIAGFIADSTVSRCYNSGETYTYVSSSAKYNAYVYAYSGGISGYMMSKGKIIDCYNTGDSTAEALRRFVYYTYAGGILGYGYNSYGSIENCYNTGTLIAALNSGGIAGFVQQGSIKNCYYLDNISVGIGKGSGNTKACTINDMQKESTYAGFDFNTVWTMKGSESYLLPELQGMEQEGGKTLTSIELTSIPAKTKYLQGKDNLDVTGGKLTLKYSDGTSEIIDLSADMVSGFDNTKTGSQTLTINYGGKTTSYDIEITAKSLSRIEVSTLPDKTKYFQNKDNLDVTGGKITLYYNNGTSEIINLTSGMVSGFDNSTVGIKTLTVTYGGKSTTYKIEIVKSTENEFAGGDGTKDNPYLVSTKEHLNNVRKYPSAYFKLLNDIDISSISNWEPIGNSYEKFTGNFDGSGHAVYGLKINVSEAEDISYFGLFGYVKDGVIKNLGVMNSEISVEASGSNYDLSVYTGGIAGSINNTTVENCCFDGNITVSANSLCKDDYAAASVSAGGISGSVYEGSLISKCYNSGNITATSESVSSYDYSYAGGIAGNLYAGEIKNCYNVGNMYSDGYSGGISGKTEGNENNPMGKIINCYNIGEIMSTDYYSGGISGAVYGSAENCYYLDTISKGTESGFGDMTSCTLEEMKQQKTFEGFDFKTVWTMDGNTGYLLPKLRGMSTVFTESLYSIEISTLPDKTEYSYGNDKLDVTGGRVTLNYNSGRSEIIDLTADMVSGFDINKTGRQTLTVTYEGKTAAFEITVIYIDHEHNYENGACTECGALDPAYKIGDVNMDGVINIYDVTLIQIYIAKLDINDKFSKALADLNNNDIIDISDVTSVQKIIAKLK